MKLLAINIKKYRKLANLTQKQLADMLNVAPTAISAWEVGRNKPLMDNIEQMASIFNIKKSELLGENSPSNANLPLRVMIETYQQLNDDNKEATLEYAVNLLDQQNRIFEFSDYLNEDTQTYTSIIRGRQSAAGQMIEVDDNQAEQDVLPSSMVPRGANELVEITGSSMEPLIAKGAEVYIRYQEVVENGEIAIVRVDGEGVTCKRFYFDGTTVTLKSENEDKEKYPDMHFSPEEVSVLGKVLV